MGRFCFQRSSTLQSHLQCTSHLSYGPLCNIGIKNFIILLLRVCISTLVWFLELVYAPCLANIKCLYVMGSLGSSDVCLYSRTVWYRYPVCLYHFVILVVYVMDSLDAIVMSVRLYGYRWSICNRYPGSALIGHRGRKGWSVYSNDGIMACYFILLSSCLALPE